MTRLPLGAAPTLCQDEHEADMHTWSEPTVTETSVGTLTGRTCLACGLNWVQLKSPDGSTLGLAG